MKQKKTVTLVVGTAVAALTLASCGGGGSGGSGGDKNAKGSDNGAVLPNTAVAKASYDDVKQGGTVVQAVSQLPTNWNNSEVDGGLQDTATIESPLLSSIRFAPDGQWEPDPNVITSAKLVSDSPQKVEVKLNPKAVWSDGKPITWEDQLNAWKALSGTNKKYLVLATNGYQDISAVTKGADEYQYTVTFKKKNADWPNYIYPPMPSLVSKTPAAFNNGFAKKMYPGNGPFVVQKIDANAGVVTEVPNPRWWGRKPKLDKLIFRVVNQDSLGQSFANKELNVLDTQANPDVLAQAMKRTDASIQKSGGLSWNQLTINGARAPLNNVHVRKAIGHAIDRTTMSAVIQKQLDVPPSVQDSVIYVPGQKGYQKTAEAQIGYSLAKSAAELKAAGYAKGSDGMYAKGGKPLALTITVPSDTPTNAQRAQLIQGFLKKAGIAMKLDTVPTAKYFTDYIDKHNFETTSFSWTGTPFPVSTTESLFYPARAGQNYAGITDPKLGPLWDKANAELDPTKQQALAHQIDKTIFQLVPMVTIATTPTIWAVQKGIVNIGASQFEVPDYTEVGFKK